MAEESQFLSFQGIRVHFRLAAPEDAPRDRIMILSSPLISSFHWRKVVPELTQLGCLVALVDLPGFGRSDCSVKTPQDAVMRANIIWGILDEIDRQLESPLSTWHLAGHGSACATILEMAGLYPESVKSQIHISPLIATAADDGQKTPPQRWYRETMYQKENFRRMVEHYSGYPMDDYILDRMRAPLIRPGAQDSFLRMLRHNADKPSCNLGFCPAMVLLGGRDAMLGGEAMDQIKHYLGTAETHVLKSAGHFPMETHSKALRDYLRGWIRFNAR